MGMISSAIDRMPSWLQMLLVVIALAAFVYGIATEGWIFIVKAIFSPEIKLLVRRKRTSAAEAAFIGGLLRHG